MQKRNCPCCSETLCTDCFRTHQKKCVWCEWANPAKRARYRFRDIKKRAKDKLKIAECEFVCWYTGQRDCCAYCHLTFDELKRLKVKRRRAGYQVSWHVDRLDSSRPYQIGNLALACFVCNMAKGDVLSSDEALVIGRAVRRVWRRRLQGF